MRLGQWCFWLRRSLPQGWGFSLPSSPSWLTHQIKCLAAAACACLCVSAGTSLAGSRQAVPPQQCCEVFAATLQLPASKAALDEALLQTRFISRLVSLVRRPESVLPLPMDVFSLPFLQVAMKFDRKACSLSYIKVPLTYILYFHKCG